MARSRRNRRAFAMFVSLFAFCVGVFVRELQHDHGPVAVILMAPACVFGIIALLPLGLYAVMTCRVPGRRFLALVGLAALLIGYRRLVKEVRA